MTKVHRRFSLFALFVLTLFIASLSMVSGRAIAGKGKWHCEVKKAGKVIEMTAIKTRKGCKRASGKWRKIHKKDPGKADAHQHQGHGHEHDGAHDHSGGHKHDQKSDAHMQGHKHHEGHEAHKGHKGHDDHKHH